MILPVVLESASEYGPRFFGENMVFHVLLRIAAIKTQSAHVWRFPMYFL